MKRSVEEVVGGTSRLFAPPTNKPFDSLLEAEVVALELNLDRLKASEMLTLKSVV